MRIRKVFRQATALMLAIAMFFTMNGMAYAAPAETDEKGTLEYVSIGASQTNGYGLSGYLPITVTNGQVPDEQLPLLSGLMTGTVSKDDLNVYGYQRAPEGGYPDLIRDAFEEKGYKVNLNQLAISSMRAEEVRMLLDNDYYGDSYTEWRFYDEQGNGWFSSAAKEEGMTNAEALEALRQEYQGAVEKADVITYDVGVNNFGVYAINRIDSGLDNLDNPKFDADFTDILEGEDYATFAKMRAAVEEMLMEYVGEANPEGAKLLQFMADTFAYALIGYCVNFDKSMEIIYDLNPDASVAVVSIQNLMKGMTAKVPGVEGEIPLGDIYGSVVEMANKYASAFSPYAERNCYAEAGNVSLFLEDLLAYDGNPDNLDQDMRDCFGLYDNSLFGWELFIKYSEYKDLYQTSPEIVDAGVDAAYDALATIAQRCAQENVLDFGRLDKLDSGEDVLGDYIESTLYSALEAGMKGQPYEVDLSVLDNPDYANAMAIAIRFNIGNSFFAHPNREGHAQRAAAILESLEKGTEGNVTGIDAIKEMAAKFVAEYYDEAYEYAYKYAVDKGYIDEATIAYKNATNGVFVTKDDSFYLAIGSVDGGRKNKDQYSDLLAEELGVEYEELSISEDTAADLRAVLTEEYTTDIAAADLITLNFSNNTITEEVIEKLFENNTEIDWSEYVGVDGVKYINKVLEAMKDKLAEEGMGDFADLMTKVVELYVYEYVSFACNYAEIVKEIKGINEDVQIVLIGMYNPFENAVLTMGDAEITIGEYVGTLVDLCNAHFTAYAMYTQDVIYVDAADVEVKEPYTEAIALDKAGSTQEAISMISSIFGRDLEPSAAGHVYIKDQILDALLVLDELTADAYYKILALFEIEEINEDNLAEVKALAEAARAAFDKLNDEQKAKLGLEFEEISVSYKVRIDVFGEYEIVFNKNEAKSLAAELAKLESELAEIERVLKVTKSKTSSAKVTNSKTTVKATWKKVGGADSYKVELYRNGKKYSTKYTSNLSYSWKNQVRGVYYKVKVSPYAKHDGKSYYGKSYTSKAKYLTLKHVKPKLTVKKSGKYQKLTAGDVNSTGYQIKVATNKKFTKGVKTYKIKTSYKALNKKVKTSKYFSNGRKYVKVRPYTTINGKTYYGNWSSVKTVKK